MKNQVGGALKNIYYSPRFQEAIQAFGGLVETGVGAGMTFSTGGVAGPLGWPIMAHGLDHYVAGMNTVWSGTPRDTVSSQLLQHAGMSPKIAGFVDNSISLVGNMGDTAILSTSRTATYSLSTQTMGQITKNGIIFAKARNEGFYSWF